MPRFTIRLLDQTDLGVDLRGLEAAVAELLLHVADACAVIEHVGRAGVAKQVAAACHLDPSPQDQALDQGREVFKPPRTVLGIEEKSEGGGTFHRLR